MSDQPLHADTIRRYLDEVASELPAEGPQCTLIVVGGALMALLGLGDATRDVDTIERLDPLQAFPPDSVHGYRFLGGRSGCGRRTPGRPAVH